MSSEVDLTAPARTCLGCGKTTQKDKLIRFVLSADKTTIEVDLHKIKTGRGVYCHPEISCLTSKRFSGRVQHEFSKGNLVKRALELDLKQILSATKYEKLVARDCSDQQKKINRGAALRITAHRKKDRK